MASLSSLAHSKNDASRLSGASPSGGVTPHTGPSSDSGTTGDTERNLNNSQGDPSGSVDHSQGTDNSGIADLLVDPASQEAVVDALCALHEQELKIALDKVNL